MKTTVAQQCFPVVDDRRLILGDHMFDIIEGDDGQIVAGAVMIDCGDDIVAGENRVETVFVAVRFRQQNHVPTGIYQRHVRRFAFMKAGGARSRRLWRL